MKSKAYRVTAGYVTVETAVSGGRAEVDIPRGELLPADVPRAQIDRDLLAGAIEMIDAPGPAVVVELPLSDVDDSPPPAPGVPADPPEIPEGMSVATTLEWVRDDPARAEVALNAETGPGGQNRSTLVDRLEKVIAASASDQPPATE